MLNASPDPALKSRGGRGQVRRIVPGGSRSKERRSAVTLPPLRECWRRLHAHERGKKAIARTPAPG